MPDNPNAARGLRPPKGAGLEATASNVKHLGRRFEGRGRRSQAPLPIMHSLHGHWDQKAKARIAPPSSPKVEG